MDLVIGEFYPVRIYPDGQRRTQQFACIFGMPSQRAVRPRHEFRARVSFSHLRKKSLRESGALSCLDCNCSSHIAPRVTRPGQHIARVSPFAGERLNCTSRQGPTTQDNLAHMQHSRKSRHCLRPRSSPNRDGDPGAIEVRGCVCHDTQIGIGPLPAWP